MSDHAYQQEQEHQAYLDEMWHNHVSAYAELINLQQEMKDDESNRTTASAT